MKLYLSSVLINFCHGDNPSIPHVPYLLGSFFYLRKVQKDKKAWVLEQISAQAPEDFLLDSGAFSFLTGTQIPDIDLYLEDYARFIKDNNIKQYFEMDIDSIVGLPKVEEYRKYLEKETGVPSIPVWHLSRGKEYFIRMCREYSYIALGGIASKEYGSKLYKYFPWFIKTAHENNCEIHGLGYTGKGLLKYRFDSVDSTSWLAGVKYGRLPYFDRDTCKIKIIPKPKNSKLQIKAKGTYLRAGVIEWVKYAKYLARVTGE